MRFLGHSLNASPKEAANLARERRLIGADLERLEAPEEVGFVDQLAVKRAEAGAGRPPSRRKSG